MSFKTDFYGHTALIFPQKHVEILFQVRLLTPQHVFILELFVIQQKTKQKRSDESGEHFWFYFSSTKSRIRCKEYSDDYPKS